MDKGSLDINIVQTVNKVNDIKLHLVFSIGFVFVIFKGLLTKLKSKFSTLIECFINLTRIWLPSSFPLTIQLHWFRCQFCLCSLMKFSLGRRWETLQILCKLHDSKKAKTLTFLVNYHRTWTAETGGMKLFPLRRCSLTLFTVLDFVKIKKKIHKMKDNIQSVK